MTYLLRRWPLRSGGLRWLVAAAVAVAVLAVFAAVDPQLSVAGQGLPGPVVLALEWITHLGESGWILIPALVLFVVSGLLGVALAKEPARSALREMAATWAFLFIGVGFPSLVTTIVKRMIGRSRPEHLEAVGAFDFRTMSWLDWTYQSFPSGHATTAFALCFVVSFLAPRSFPWMLGMAVLVGLSRIVVGAHYATDVIGGAIVGVLGAYIVRNVFASRGWGFAVMADGTVVREPMIAVAALLGKRR
jgi:membrane-associated phospholipid phosphatase